MVATVALEERFVLVEIAASVVCRVRIGTQLNILHIHAVPRTHYSEANSRYGHRQAKEHTRVGFEPMAKPNDSEAVTVATLPLEAMR